MFWWHIWKERNPVESLKAKIDLFFSCRLSSMMRLPSSARLFPRSAGIWIFAVCALGLCLEFALLFYQDLLRWSSALLPWSLGSQAPRFLQLRGC
jgi:hypothetical protein